MRWIASLLLLVTGAATAQPEPIPVELALAMAREAYRTSPVADRVAVTFIDERSRRASDQLIVRIDAASASPIVALDLGRLHVSASHARLVAIHDAEATTCWTADLPDPFTGDALQLALPPLPLPQLALALSPDATVTTPYTPSIVWRDAQIDPAARPPALTLQGRAADLPVTLVLDPTTGRVRTFEAQLSPDTEVARLTLQCAPIDPGSVGDWAIDVGARRSVDKLHELTAPPRGLVAGDLAPDVKAFSLDLGGWSLHEAVGEGDQAHPVGLIAFRAATEDLRAEQIHRDVGVCVQAIALLLEQAPHPSLTMHAVTVVDLSETELEVVRSMAARWAGAAPHAQFERALRWTSDGAHAIDAFDPDADALLILVSPDKTIIGARRLDGFADDQDAFTRDVASLFNSIPAQAADGGVNSSSGDSDPREQPSDK